MEHGLATESAAGAVDLSTQLSHQGINVPQRHELISAQPLIAVYNITPGCSDGSRAMQPRAIRTRASSRNGDEYRTLEPRSRTGAITAGNTTCDWIEWFLFVVRLPVSLSSL